MQIAFDLGKVELFIPDENLSLLEFVGLLLDFGVFTRAVLH